MIHVAQADTISQQKGPVASKARVSVVIKHQVTARCRLVTSNTAYPAHLASEGHALRFFQYRLSGQIFSPELVFSLRIIPWTFKHHSNRFQAVLFNLWADLTGL